MEKFLTDIPNNSTVGYEQEFQMSFITQRDTVKLWYQTFDLSNNGNTPVILPSVTMQNEYELYKRGTIPVSKYSIFNSATSKVCFALLDSSTDQVISEVRTFKIDQKCYNSPVVLEFKNKRGGFDSYQFIETIETVQKTKKNNYISNGIKGTFHTNTSLTQVLEGRWELNSILTWLTDLYESDTVYKVDSTYPEGRILVNLLESDYILQDNNLRSPTVTIELQTPNNNQI